MNAELQRKTLLGGLRVVEIDDGSAQFAGKCLADMGAHVIKLEPSAGSPARHVGPFADDQPDVDMSLHFWANNTSKQSVTADLDTAAGQRLTRRLLSEADVFLYGGSPQRLDELEMSPSQLATEHPHLVVCAVTPFGLDGPWRDWASSDALQSALGGPMGATGYEDRVDGGAPQAPIAPTGGHTAYLASMIATVGLLAAAIDRRRTQRGQVVDVATHDVLSVSSEMSNIYWEYGHGNVVRQAGRHARPMLTPVWNHLTADGKYFMALPLYLDDERFATLAKWLAVDNNQTALLADELKTEAGRVGKMARIVDEIQIFCRSQTTAQLFEGAKQRRLPWAPVHAPEELLDVPHLSIDRGTFLAVDDLGLASSPLAVAVPFKVEGIDWALSRAPRLGEHTASVEEHGFG